MQRHTEIPVEVHRRAGDHGDGSGRWWDAASEAVARDMQSAARRCEADSQDRVEAAMMHMALYTNVRVTSLYAAGMALGTRGWGVATLGHMAKYNVVKSAVDTVYNMIAKNRPRVVPLANGGDWKSRRRAKKAKLFLDGAFYECAVYEKARRAFIDACVFDCGVLAVAHHCDRLIVERVLPIELFVDEGDAVYGAPTVMYRRKYVDRTSLMRMYPEHAQAIAGAARASVHPSQGYDMVTCWEGWRLPGYGPDNELVGGRHVVACGDAALVDEPWTRTRFPVAVMRWTHPVVGYWGQSLVSELAGIQFEINDMLRAITEAARRTRPRVYVEIGSKVTAASMGADDGLTYYSGQRPIESAPQLFSPDYYAHLERLKRWAFEAAGVSELSAGARKPSGLDSGAALREYNNIESARQVTHGQDYERLIVDVAELILEEAAAMYADGVDWAPSRAAKDFIESVPWSEVAQDDPYRVQLFPASSLPTHPAARMETVAELYKSGMIGSKEEAMRLLDFPDLESDLSVRIAAIDDVHRAVDGIADGGDYEPPDPMSDLRYAIQYAQSVYLRGRGAEQPDDVQELLLRYAAEAGALLDSMAGGDSQPAREPEPLVDGAPPPAAPSPPAPLPSPAVPAPQIPALPSAEAAMPPPGMSQL